MPITISGTQAIDRRVLEWVRKEFGLDVLVKGWAIEAFGPKDPHQLRLSLEVRHSAVPEVWAKLLPYMREWPYFAGEPGQYAKFQGALLINVNDFERKDEERE